MRAEWAGQLRVVKRPSLWRSALGCAMLPVLWCGIGSLFLVHRASVLSGLRSGFASVMKFRAEQYFRVSVERMGQARKLYAEGNAFALSMYCGGLAVESLLRAFRWTDDTSFEGRHDLSDLLKASRLLKFDDDYMRRRGASEESIWQSGSRIRGAMNQVFILWHNNLRFASEASAEAILKQAGKFKGVKGNPLKKNALDLVEAAQIVVDRGVVLWTSEIRS